MPVCTFENHDELIEREFLVLVDIERSEGLSDFVFW